MHKIVASSLAVMMVSLIWISTALANPRQAATNEPVGGFAQLQLDNDAYFLACIFCSESFDEDRAYTGGLRLQVGGSQDAVSGAPFWWRVIGRPDRVGWLGGVTLEVYTPIDLTVAAIQPHDRPYAGFSHLDLGARALWDKGRPARASARLAVGVIGPCSFAGGAQTALHGGLRKLRDDKEVGNKTKDPIPRGWKIDEVGDGKSLPAAQLTVDYEVEVGRIALPFTASASLTAGVETTLGSLEVAGGATLTGRIGLIHQAWPVASSTGHDAFLYGRVSGGALPYSGMFKGGGGRQIAYRHGYLQTELGFYLQLCWMQITWSINTQSQQLAQAPPWPAEGVRKIPASPRNAAFEHVYGRVAIGGNW